MRQLIGTIVLIFVGIGFLATGSFFGLVPLALGVSGIVFAINPQLPLGVPGGVVAIMVGSVVVVAFFAVALGEFFDDC